MITQAPRPIQKIWREKPASPQLVQQLAQQLNGNVILSRLLVQRGISQFEAAKSFFNPSKSELHDPALMRDMPQAVARLDTAIRRQEKILVYGDYDVDGTTSVALMYQYLRSIYSESQLGYYIPNRYREGYGISEAGIQYAIQQGFSLVIALDCGIKSVELIQQAHDHGVDFIVCDHHLPDAILPPAAAILNPKQPGCLYPYKELCGCGIGYKFISAFSQHLGQALPGDAFLDLVATAIAADIVPMTGENRILTWLGLQKINQDPSPAIKALVQLGKASYPLSITDVVFILAPRINAAGRMDDARKAVELFLQTQEEAALQLAESLHADNTERKEADAQITAEALEQITGDPNHQQQRATVVFGEHWKKGVVGIVASRLIEHYHRPTVVLAQHEQIITGSARSVPGFNLYEAIHACRHHLLGYGGHFAAAGLSLLPEKLNDFKEAFEQVVANTISPESQTPEIAYDIELPFYAITQTLYQQLKRMEPFGPENMRPIFRASQVHVLRGTRVVKEAHVRFEVEQAGTVFTGIGFGLAHQAACLFEQQPIDLLFTVDENTWNNQTSLQLRVLDFKPSLEL